MRAPLFTPAQRWALRRRRRLGVLLGALWHQWLEVPLVSWHDGAPSMYEHDEAVAVSLIRSGGRVARVQAVRWCRHGAELLCQDYLGRTVTRRVTWPMILHEQGRVNTPKEPRS